MTKIYNVQPLKSRRQYLRKNMTATEGIFWNRVRNNQILGFRFFRKCSIGAYVVDFYCPRIRLAIEIDGTYHNKKSQIEYDNQRQEYIENVFVTFLRFSDEMILNSINQVLEKLKAESVI